MSEVRENVTIPAKTYERVVGVAGLPQRTEHQQMKKIVVSADLVDKMQQVLVRSELLIDAMRRENSLVSMHVHAHTAQLQEATVALRAAMRDEKPPQGGQLFPS